MPSTALQKSRHSQGATPLKQIQPKQLWTFDNALSLLRTCQDKYILDGLDEYLLLNNEVLTSPFPFHTEEKLTDDVLVADFSLRNILYSDLTDSNKEDAKTLSELLKIDYKESLRVIRQTCFRIPERKIKNYDKFKSKLPDDREKYLKEERILLYSGRVLRERRTILKLVAELVSNKMNPEMSSTVRNLGKQIVLSGKYLSGLIANISSLVGHLNSGTLATGFSKELDDLIYVESLLLIIESAKVLIELLTAIDTVSKEGTLEWFEFVSTNGSSLALSSHMTYTESFALIQSLFTVVSLLFMDLENNFEMENTGSYLNHGSIFKKINDTIVYNENSTSVVLFSWSVLLLKKSIILEEYNQPDFTAIITVADIKNSIRIAESRLETSSVFKDLANLNELLKFDNVYATILANVLLTTLPLVSLTSELASSIASILENAPSSIIEKFFGDELFVNTIILARTKFPISLTPYLKLASINGRFALAELQEMKSYISLFKRDQVVGLYDIDDENTELVKLVRSVDIYPPYEINKKLSLVLASGTKAKILPSADDNSVLMTFLYKFNGWAFLGRVLQNISKVYDNSDAEKVELVVNILSLLTRTIQNCLPNESRLILETMSAYTDDSDIIEVIFRLFEQGLHSRNTVVLKTLLKLFASLMPLVSNRIWLYLSKSSLFSQSGKEGLASTIFGSIEMVKGDYSFTVSLVDLVHALFQNSLSLHEEYPERSRSLILSNLVSHLIMVFESFLHCRFNHGYQKLELGVLILDLFSSILATVYGIDEKTKSDEKATKVFASSATKIIDSFLVTGSDCSRVSFPLLSMVDSLASSISTYEICDVSGFWYDNWIRCGLAFSQLVISVRSSLDLKPSTLERSLFTKLPSLVNAYAQYPSLRKGLLDLISALTNGSWDEGEQPSLLSHLGRDYAHVLLHSLASDLDNAFDDYKVKISLYDFICAVMDGKQEGLSVLLLSGRDVFGEFADIDKTEPKPLSLLNILKKNVNDINYYPNVVSLHLVDAIALAFNSWTTVRVNDDDTEFINLLITRIQAPLHETPQTVEDYISVCYELKLVSKIAEILSLFLFTTKNEKCKNSIINLISSQEFVRTLRTRFTIEDNQPSLHSNLQVSFENEFPGLELLQFRVSLLKRNRFGLATVYNLVLMDRLFKDETQWTNLREQVIASSMNIQYLNSQVSIAKSFGGLLTAFCRKSPQSLDTKFLTLVSDLLKINTSENIDTDVSSLVYQERVELAFFLLYNCPDAKRDSAVIIEIIKVASELLTSSSLNFLTALTNDSVSYRSLLRIIYISLNSVKDRYDLILEAFSVFRDLFDLIVAKGTRTILVELQNDVYRSRTSKKQSPEKLAERLDDLQLVFLIVKVFVSLKAPSDLHSEMATLMSDNGTIKALLNLYSVSYLIEVNDEHIFAQLSLMFVQQLLTIKVMAEKFYSTGLFIVLVESTISHPIKTGGLSVATGAQHHRIWINGLLPVFLTILSKLGPSIIREFSYAVQSFGKQIEYCVESWARDSSSIKINTAVISETSQILLMFQMIQSLNIDFSGYNGARNGSVSGGMAVDMPILPGLETEAKRDDFVDCINNLLKHPKFLASRISASSAEEQRTLEKRDDAYETFVKYVIEEIRDLRDFLVPEQ